ncbi:hypothetical protein ACS8Y6_16320 [Salinisphaera sp. RV14]|uniref:hypothetical protein n=1 Tax=Salinisphaera sp. RV14 TaxID=3454140 RepID=UPI003F82C768
MAFDARQALVPDPGPSMNAPDPPRWAGHEHMIAAGIGREAVKKQLIFSCFVLGYYRGGRPGTA